MCQFYTKVHWKTKIINDLNRKRDYMDDLLKFLHWHKTTICSHKDIFQSYQSLVSREQYISIVLKLILLKDTSTITTYLNLWSIEDCGNVREERFAVRTHVRILRKIKKREWERKATICIKLIKRRSYQTYQSYANFYVTILKVSVYITNLYCNVVL